MSEADIPPSTMKNHYSASASHPAASEQGFPINNTNKIALYWLTTAVGAVLFATFQSFSYVNDYVRANGATPAITFEPDVLWIFSAFYGSWIITVLLTLIGTRTTQWIALVLGSVLVVLNTIGGVFDGLRDGGHIVFSALFFIGLPGIFAIVATWRHIQRKGTGHVYE